MTYLPILLQIAVVYLVAAITPGPNFFMISQLSLAGRRSLGAASALGVGTASIAWATLAMLGLAAVLHQVEWMYDIVACSMRRQLFHGRRRPATAPGNPTFGAWPRPMLVYIFHI
ncbi:LysE family transporter, partial [Burkholderia sp. Ac-20384]|uniref:LysE family translocator n=1 Tax=Burkholderia sp. Ac-20384 TaxID=2703902 RepID=UPI001F11FF3D